MKVHLQMQSAHLDAGDPRLPRAVRRLVVAVRAQDLPPLSLAECNLPQAVPVLWIVIKSGQVHGFWDGPVAKKIYDQ